MKPLYSSEEYHAATGYVKLPLECYHCNKTFFAEKKYIKSILKRGIVGCKFCSNDCNAKFFRTSIEAPCSQCGKMVMRQPKEVRKSRSKRMFCNRSCSASYHNVHKTFGTVRSKLEIWIEERLREKYPHLEIVCNRKDAIQSELDIYLPKLQLAFELNGLFHYQPVFGEEKLAAIQKMDEIKKVACQDAGIKLVSIDISDQSRFHPKTSGKYLQIVLGYIEEMLSAQEII